MELSAEDIILMNRLFGSRLPDEGAEFSVEAKAVDFATDGDLGAALGVLLQSIVHTGIGEGFVAGWRLYESGGRKCIAVSRFKPAADLVAA